ncbi:radical SAM protein, partial [Candidatus Magnetobacterium casense]
MTTPFALQNVSLEATRLCNLRCIMCPTHKANADPEINRKYPAYFDIGRYRDIIEQLAELDTPLHIGPQFQGEPLLSKAIYEMVRIAKSKGFSTGFSTNAVLLTEWASAELIEAGLDALCISVDAVTKETFEKIRVGANYDRVVKNINTFLSMRGKTPSVCINGVRMPENKAEIDRLVDVWLPKVESVSISNVWDGEKGVAMKHYTPERFPCQSLW